MALTRPPASAGADGLRGASMEGLEGLDISTTIEYLAEANWSDGSERQTSTLLLFTEGGLWKACLRDRALERSCWVTGRSLREVLEVLELGVASDRIEWRADRPQGKRK